jgi:hypothetical protein
MSPDPTRLGSLKTTSSRTQMDLPNVYWTFTTPLATIIGLFSNVSETEAELHQDQIDWFKGEPSLAGRMSRRRVNAMGDSRFAANHPPPSSYN